MATSDGFIHHITELLSPLGHVVAKRMFGGHGVYVDGLFVAILADDELYLKVDDITRAEFEAEGCAPFTYDAKGKPMVMSYYRAPGEAMDAPHLMQPWARRALDAALRARALKVAATQSTPAKAKPETAKKPKRLAAKARIRR